MRPDASRVEGVFESAAAAAQAVKQLRPALPHHDITVTDEPVPLLETLLPVGERSNRVRVRIHTHEPAEAADLLLEQGAIDLRRNSANVASMPAPEDHVLALHAEEPNPRLITEVVGEIRVSKRVVTEKRSIEVELRREEVVIEHFQGAATELGAAGPVLEMSDDEQVIRIPLLEERVHVEKVPVVAEEVVVRKRRILESTTLVAELGREEPVIETRGAVHLQHG